MQPEIDYVGHHLSHNKIAPLQSKFDAIIHAPIPEGTDKATKLQKWIGMLQYYNEHVPMLSSILKPLYALNKDNWEWSIDHTTAFQNAKFAFLNSKIIVPFNPKKKQIIVAAEISNYGLGGALYCKDENGTENHVFFGFRTLTTAKQNYSQIEKEGLITLIFACKNKFFIGREFTLLSDHKPLITIFGENKSLPAMAKNRLQRWANFLSSFKNKIKHCPGKDLIIADTLSRLPLNK
jgi:hypothetical protein